jgi:hypothetical protein
VARKRAARRRRLSLFSPLLSLLRSARLALTFCVCVVPSEVPSRVSGGELERSRREVRRWLAIVSKGEQSIEEFNCPFDGFVKAQLLIGVLVPLEYPLFHCIQFCIQ